MARKYRPRKGQQPSPEDEAFVNDVDSDEDGPPSINPYTVLELNRQASSEHVKKAYRKLALKYHPGM